MGSHLGRRVGAGSADCALHDRNPRQTEGQWADTEVTPGPGEGVGGEGVAESTEAPDHTPKGECPTPQPPKPQPLASIRQNEGQNREPVSRPGRATALPNFRSPKTLPKYIPEKVMRMVTGCGWGGRPRQMGHRAQSRARPVCVHLELHVVTPLGRGTNNGGKHMLMRASVLSTPLRRGREGRQKSVCRWVRTRLGFKASTTCVTSGQDPAGPPTAVVRRARSNGGGRRPAPGWGMGRGSLPSRSSGREGILGVQSRVSKAHRRHGTTASNQVVAAPSPPRDALEGKGPQRRPQRPLDRRLEGVAKAVGGGYYRLNAIEAGTCRQGDSGWA